MITLIESTDLFNKYKFTHQDNTRNIIVEKVNFLNDSAIEEFVNEQHESWLIWLGEENNQ
jgi:hypothetical protein